MKKITFTCDDAHAVKVMTVLMPFVQTLVMEDTEPMKVLPRLEAPPSGSLKDFRHKGRLRKGDGRANKRFTGETVTPPGLQEKILDVARMHPEGFTLNELSIGLANIGIEANRKTLNNNVMGMRRRKMFEIAGGDRNKGYAYRLVEG